MASGGSEEVEEQLRTAHVESQSSQREQLRHPQKEMLSEPQLELCHQLRAATNHHKPTNRGSSRLRSLCSKVSPVLVHLKPLRREYPSIGSIHCHDTGISWQDYNSFFQPSFSNVLTHLDTLFQDE